MTTVDATRQAWLAERQTAIGASESPAILGEGYEGENAWSVWARKLGLESEKLWTDEAREAMEWGIEDQAGIIRRLIRETGLDIRENDVFFRSLATPFIGATPDGLVTMEGEIIGVVEAKCVDKDIGHLWSKDVPLRFQIQVQHQMYVLNVDFAFVAAKIGGNRFVHYRVDRNERFIAGLVRKLTEFWRLVETRTPPPVDSNEATTRVLNLLYPHGDFLDEPGQEIILPAEADQWDRDIAEAVARIKVDEAMIADRKNRLREAMGPAMDGVLPSGGRWRWRSITVDYKAKEAYSVTRPDFRRLKK